MGQGLTGTGSEAAMNPGNRKSTHIITSRRLVKEVDVPEAGD